MKIERNHFRFEDVVLQHNLSTVKSRSEINTQIQQNGIILDTPVVLSNMPSCQNEEVLKIFNEQKWPYVYHRMFGNDDIYKFVEKINAENWNLKSISVGVQEKDIELLRKIKEAGLKLDWITVDVALIYNTFHGEIIKQIRQLSPDVYLIAGNFSNPLTVNWLYDLGVDCGKFNIGVSKLCRTAQYTGFGSTLNDFIETVEVSKIDLMFDGGITILDEEKGEIAYGDIFKSLVMGSKWMMSSSAFRWAEELAVLGSVHQYGNSTATAKGFARREEGAVKAFKPQYKLLDQMIKIKDHLQSSCSYAGITDINNAYNSCEVKILK